MLSLLGSNNTLWSKILSPKCLLHVSKDCFNFCWDAVHTPTLSHLRTWKGILQFFLFIPLTKLSLGCGRKIFLARSCGRFPTPFPSFSLAYLIYPLYHMVLFNNILHHLQIGNSTFLENFVKKLKVN